MIHNKSISFDENGDIDVDTFINNITKYPPQIISQNEKMGKHDFFRAVIRGFVDDDERLVSFLTDYRDIKLSKKKQKVLDKERKRGKDYENKLALSDEEKEDIFDLLEEEQGL
jgi:hypothetical protein